MADKKGLSYADAGVSIDAGDALVDRIKPMVKSTRRRGADGTIGGFGGSTRAYGVETQALQSVYFC